MTLSANQAKRHLQDHGLIFGLPPEKLDRRLEKVMGQQRFMEYLARLDDSRVKGRPISLVYELFESLEEANLAMSHQSELTRQVALWFLGRLERLTGPDFTILDLGCWTGALTRVVAKAFPNCRVIGVDRLPRIVEFASAACAGIPNIEFLVWDYFDVRQRPNIRANALLSSLGIDFQLRKSRHSLDVRVLRGSPSYNESVAEILPYLTAWRSVAADGASLFAVLRLSDVEPMLALADAAHSSGWTLQVAESTKIHESSESKIPALDLSADDSSEILAEDEVVSWYGWPEDATVDYMGAQAIAVYRSLGEKIITRKHSKTFSDGHTMTVEIGRVGSTGFLFARATTGYAELRIGALRGIDELAPSFGWDQLT